MLLRKHEPNHVLLRATRHDVAWNLADIARLNDFLARIQNRIQLRRLDRVTPLAAPVLLDIGRESIDGGAIDELLDDAAQELIAEATEGEAQESLL